MMKPETKEHFDARVSKALEAGRKAGAAMREAQKGAKGTGRLGMRCTGQLPAELRTVLMDKYGAGCLNDPEFRRDLRRNHPEMMDCTGEGYGDNIIGTKNRFGNVSWSRRGGRWYRRVGDGWVPGEPPSRMNWKKPEAPAIIG